MAIGILILKEKQLLGVQYVITFLELMVKWLGRKSIYLSTTGKLVIFISLVLNIWFKSHIRHSGPITHMMLIKQHNI